MTQKTHFYRQTGIDRGNTLIIWGVAIVGLLLVVFNLWQNRLFFHDDTFISLRYARNLVNFGELSWNIGDRVEGYTNFLHLVSSAGLIRLGFDPMSAVQGLNAVSSLVLLTSVYFGARFALPDQPVLQILAVVAVAGNVSLAVWIFGGLEAPMAAALVSCGVVAALPLFSDDDDGNTFGAAFWSAIFFACAALTRPDSVITIAAASLSVLAMANGPFAERFFKAAIVGGGPFLVLCGHMAWRVSYYGDYLPNTFHAKVGVDFNLRLQKVVPYFLQAGARYLPILTLAGLAYGLLVLMRRSNRMMLFLVAMIVAHSAYVIWSGGDHMAASRVLLPMASPCALLLTIALSKLPTGLAKIAVILSLIGMVAASAFARSFNIDWAAYNGTVVGTYISETWPKGSVIALNTAGSTPFHADEMIFIDMLGLNDRVIAKRKDVPRLARRQRMPGHSKGDGAYVMSRKPNYIIFGGSEGIDVKDAEKWFLTGMEVRDLPEFQDCYVLNNVDLPIPANLLVYERQTKDISFSFYERICASAL